MRTKNGNQAGGRPSWSEIVIPLWLVLSALAMVWLIAACAPAATPEELPAKLTDTSTSVPAASATDSVTLSRKATVPLTTEARATVRASLPPTPTPDVSRGVPWSEADAGVIPLSVGEGGPLLWAVFTQGMRLNDPDRGHFLAIYTHDGQDWQELDRVVLTSCAEYVGSESLTQVEVEPSHTWLELQSGAGAHSGCYDLLSFDGERLRFEASNSHSSPRAGWLEDLDGDGSPEVVLDLTENYVFCYACGLRYPRFSVLRWDGDQLAKVQLSALPQAAPTELQSLNTRASGTGPGWALEGCPGSDWPSAGSGCTGSSH